MTNCFIWHKVLYFLLSIEILKPNISQLYLYNWQRRKDYFSSYFNHYFFTGNSNNMDHFGPTSLSNILQYPLCMFPNSRISNIVMKLILKLCLGLIFVDTLRPPITFYNLCYFSKPTIFLHVFFNSTKESVLKEIKIKIFFQAYQAMKNLESCCTRFHC
jgi:hypothetical protein